MNDPNENEKVQIDDDKCKCVLLEQSCPWCNPSNDEFIGYPSMPDYPISPDWYEMWELE